MQCVKCDTELIPGKQFCHACGAGVGATCASCGQTLESGFRFCPDCGAPIGQPIVPSMPAPPVSADSALTRLSRRVPDELAEKIRASGDVVAGERKQVTVLFCDLAGSTAIAERLDPEEYHDLLDRFLESALKEIYRYEGIVNQLAGDGMMALFGAPIAHEDAPQRAVRAALGVREGLRLLNQQLRSERGIELRARIGIHTGPVVVGTVGNDLKMDYTAIGDTTNLAARLESLAQPGTILMSEATQRLVRGLFEVHEVGPFTVKGKSEPVTAYEVVEAREAVTPMVLAKERGLTPFVGRDEELRQLEACFARLQGHLAQIVAIVGEAGSGKSRLIYEFKQRVAEYAPVFFEARCSALNQMVPNSPWVAMLKHYFTIAANDPAKCICEKVAAKVRAWDRDLTRAYPYLCHMLGVPVSGVGEHAPGELKRQIFEAVGSLIKSESQHAPVVILIEDLQWIDEPSRETLERAVAEINAGQVMLLVSHRPDYQQSWRTSAAFTRLHLRRLSDHDVTKIMRALTGAALPPELEHLILTKAEGSPFFTEEITRGLIEGGYLARENGHHRVTRPVEEIRIPGTVQEVLAARLDRLGTDAKRVVQVAAVLGRQFSREQLGQLLAADGIEVDRELDELERRGVIHRKTLFSNDEYRFGESLTQEVAYESLLLKQRRQLHERIGGLLEVYSDDASSERAALLAQHFVRSDNHEKAGQALLRAAQQAEKVPSYRTAARFYRETWDLAAAALDRDPGVHKVAVAAAIGLARMTVIYNAADPDEGEPIVARASQLAEHLDDLEARVGLRAYLGMMMMRDRARFAEGLAFVEQGLAIAERAGVPSPAFSRALAWSYLLDGRFALALRTINWVVTELERQGQGERLTDIYLGGRYMRARVRYHSNDIDGALQEAADTYDLAVRAANRTVQSGTSLTMAQINFVRGNYAEAKRFADRSMEMAQAVGNLAAARAEAAIALAAATELGEPVNATRYLDLIGLDTTPEGEVGLSSHLVVDALLTAGEFKRAERCARSAYDQASGRLREMLAAAGMGDVLVRHGPEQWAEAARCYTIAITLAEALEARSVLAAARLGAAEVARARGDTSAAARQLDQVLTICAELGLKRYLRRAERLLGELEAAAEQRAQ
jgi:class 3 adenylate cyclase